MKGIPWQIRDEVELWARQHGRHATIGWNHAMRCAVIEITLKPDDPRLLAWQNGRLKFEPKETVPLHFQPAAGGPFCPIDLEQLGVSGLREMLERANTWSGRGEYESIYEAVKAVGRRNQLVDEQLRKLVRENCRSRREDMRRQVFGLPLVSVPADIGARADGQAQ